MRSVRKTIWITLFLCAGIRVGAENVLDVRMQLRDQRVLAGQLTGRSDGHILFRQTAEGEAVRVPDSMIQQLQFRVSSDENARIVRFYDAREFRTIAEPLERMLTPILPYIALRSNQTENFLRWMVTSYWTGNFERALELANVLVGFPEPYRRAAMYYRVLAQAETGRMDEVALFLQSEQGDEVFDLGTPARMYLGARLLQHEGQTMDALRKAAMIIATHSRSTEWMPRVELLCAQLYFELGRMDSAQGVLDDIAEFYDDPMIQEQAAMLAAKHNQTERGQ